MAFALKVMEERIFTLSEAVDLLPRLRSILEDTGAEWGRMKRLNPHIQKARDKAQFGGFSPYGVEYLGAVFRLMFQLQHIRDLGVVLKDVDRGLCDFPYRRNGRVVYLCWESGEDTIGYWHDVEAGFAGREPLDETDK